MALLSQHRAHVRRTQRWQCWQRLASATAVALFAGLHLSCAAITGENSDSCEGDKDIDGDGLMGCRDPDCHRFELCRGAFALAPDAGDDDDRDAASPGGQGGSSGTGTPVGGMSGGMSGGGSGGQEPIEDSGVVEPDASLCDCEADEVCSSTGCVPIDMPDPVYTLRILSAESPRGKFGPPPDGTCVEIACDEGGGSPVSYCPCTPEPYVRVVLINDPNGLDAGETNLIDTKVVGEQLSVGYEDEQVDVALKPGDTLRFELWDDQTLSADVLIYDCTPDLNGLEPGPLECSVLSGPANLEEFWIRGSLELAQ